MKQSELIKSLLNSFVLVAFLFVAQPCFAATVLHQIAASTSSIAASTTRYDKLVSGSRSVVQATESNVTTIWRSGGTFSNLYINVLTNDRAASTFRTRKGTANANLVVSITGSTTGKFEDTVNTDTVTAGDNWHSSIVTGAGGTTFTSRIHSILFAATTDTVQRLGGSPSAAISTASATNPGPLYGDADYAAGEADSLSAITLRTAGTLKNLFVYSSANARTTTTTFKSRIGGVAGNLTLDIVGAATGSFEDTTNTDTVSVGNAVNWAATTGTGTEALTIRTICLDLVTTNGNHQYTAGSAGAGQTAGLTNYYPLSGRINPDSTEAQSVAETNLAFTSSLLQCNISVNTIVLDSTLNLRKNSGVANQTVAITALTTGIFQDTVNTDSIVATDTLNYQVITPSTVTAITIRSISLLGDSTVAGTRRIFLVN